MYWLRNELLETAEEKSCFDGCYYYLLCHEYAQAYIERNRCVVCRLCAVLLHASSSTAPPFGNVWNNNTSVSNLYVYNMAWWTQILCLCAVFILRCINSMKFSVEPLLFTLYTSQNQNRCSKKHRHCFHFQQMHEWKSERTNVWENERVREAGRRPWQAAVPNLTPIEFRFSFFFHGISILVLINSMCLNTTPNSIASDQLNAKYVVCN